MQFSLIHLLLLQGSGARGFDISALANVITSLPFMIIGLANLKPAFAARRTTGPSVLVFVLSLMLVGAGSVVYHALPSSGHLLWDRLPIAICMAALACAVADLYPGGRAGSVLLVPLIAVSVVSVLYWYVSLSHGHEELIPYAVVQAGSAIFAGLVVFTRPSQMAGITGLRWAMGVYAVGRIFEWAEQPIYNRLHIDMGHSAKHVLVAYAALLLVRNLGLAIATQGDAPVLKAELSPAE